MYVGLKIQDIRGRYARRDINTVICRGRGRRQLRPRHAYQRIDRVAPERRSSSRTAQVNSPNRRLEATSHGPPAASVQEWLNHCWAQRWTEKLGVPSNFLNSLSFRFSF